ncbi:serine protease [Rhodobacter sp. SY28-1]|uniref:serine protease n=1 Tax=Rhodobacter sp. SY28-1 TaxID=2562317 RepID=UPI0010BF6EFB|nr:serine protease [Rhodobacter sp. SY28-1]
MTEAALTPTQAEALAKGITGSRLAFAAVYDETAARMGRDLPDFKTVALGIHDPRAAFEAALIETGKTDPPWHRVLLAELATQGMIDLTEALDAPGSAAGGLSILPQNADGSALNAADFSKVIAPALRMADLLHAFSLAARRLCLITVAGETSPSKGTGFLVGPQTVLTNHHVVADLIDPITGKAKDGSAAKISCKFETLTEITGRSYAVADDWLIDFSPVDLNPVANPAPAAGPKRLDYCAIRLKGAPGRERGWYDLTQTGALDKDTDAFFVFQHPHGVPQRAAFATHTAVEPNKDFLRHNVWTSPGSSGGLCLDNRLRPIAMHQGSVLGGGAEPRRRAIRLEAIRQAAKDLERVDPKLDRISQLSDGSAAVIGRDATQSTLRMMAEGRGTYILVIRGAAQSGKTFSSLLLRDSIPGEQRVIISLTAGRLPADARDLARAILRQAGLSEAEIKRLFAPLATLTTSAATVADVFAILKRALQGIAGSGTPPGKLVWLLIDDLDKVKLPQIGSRTLLDHIYSDGELEQIMRIVLIGLSDTLVNVGPDKISTEVLADPGKVDPKEIEECLGRLLQEAGKVTLAETASLQARLVAYSATELKNWMRNTSPLARMSGFVSRVYMKAIR